MNKFLLLLLFIFVCIKGHTQEEKPFNVQNAYLQELLNAYEDLSFNGYDIDNPSWRAEAIEKLTSSSNVQENSFLKTVMILHMLKYKLGDQLFNAAVSKYKKHLESKDLDADIQDFQYFLENESNEELTYFFNDWFKSKGHPSYEIGWFQNPANNYVNFTIKQNQSDATVDFFELPVPLKLLGENDQYQSVRLEISEDRQNFSATIPFKIVKVEIDPEHHLITRDNRVKLGIDQEKLNKEISLYPNPAIQFIAVQNTSEAIVEKVSIYNMLGKLLLEEKNPKSSINVKSLAAGMHLVKIETSQGTLHKTILKK